MTTQRMWVTCLGCGAKVVSQPSDDGRLSAELEHKDGCPCMRDTAATGAVDLAWLRCEIEPGPFPVTH